MLSEREQLTRLVQQWNENRLDLFHLSYPTEELEIEGVMRFYFLEVGEKVSTKCIRVSSTATTRAVIDALVEKFLPDLRMLTDSEYSLWEVHEGGEERRLDQDEKPLLVQLTWHKDDREGRFLLKKHGTQYLPLQNATQEDIDVDRGLKRFSKREKKEIKKKHQQNIVSVNAGREEEYVVTDIYREVPANTFTRTISNPEVVMKKRRERKLEAKLGEMGNGGSLKIYGMDLVPSRPYVTLLVGMRDKAKDVVREALEKYALTHLDAHQFALAQSTLPPDHRRSMSDLHSESEMLPTQRVLDDEECPLLIAANRPPDAPEVYFSIRKRTTPIYKKISSMNSIDIETQQIPASDPGFAVYNPDGFLPVPAQVLPILPGVTEVGSDRSIAHFSTQNILLDGDFILGRHCVITFMDGVVTVTPSAPQAVIQVNNRHIEQTAILKDGDVVTIGIGARFKFVLSVSRFAAAQGASIGPAAPLQNSNMHISSRNHPERAGMSPVDPATMMMQPQQNQQQNLQQNQQHQQLQGSSHSPSSLPMSIQIGDYRVWDFLIEVVGSSWEEVEAFRLSPAYSLYLALRFFHSNSKPYLVQFMTRLSAQISQIAKGSENEEELLLWLANSSELSFLVDMDPDIEGLSQQRAVSLSSCVERLLRRLIAVLRRSLDAAAQSLLNTTIDDSSAVQEVLSILDRALRSARSCRLNAALTIQLSSQLFHALNARLFNTLVGLAPNPPKLCLTLGQCLSRRLILIHAWAERMGLELAAECHLDRINQAAKLLESPKNDVTGMGSTTYRLNSVQLRYLLTNYELSNGESPIDEEVLKSLIGLSEEHADAQSNQDGRPILLEEADALSLPFLLPQDGYAAEQLKGVPDGLLSYVLRLQTKGLCHSVTTFDADSPWKIVPQPQGAQTPSSPPIQQTFVSSPQPQMLQPQHNNQQYATQMDTSTSTLRSSKENGRSSSRASTALEGGTLDRQNPYGTPQDQRVGNTSMHGGEQIVKVSLQRGPKGIGLSIVAAQGVGDTNVGIYVKKVVEGGVAAQDGRLDAGDQLLTVNGVSLQGITQEQAAHQMANSGQLLTFEVRKGAALNNGLAVWLCKDTPTSATSQGPNPFGPGAGPAGPRPTGLFPSQSHSSQQSLVHAHNTVTGQARPEHHGYTQRGQAQGPQHHQRQPQQQQQLPPQPLPRHQRSASASDLYHNDPNASFSQRSICSTSGFPSGRQLPSYYKSSTHRPTVIQPGRPQQSPSSIRRGAHSPNPLYRPPSMNSMASLQCPPSSSAAVSQSYHEAVERPQHLPPNGAMRRVEPQQHQQQQQQYQSGAQTGQNVYRASSSLQLQGSPPVSQSSPRQQPRQTADQYANQRQTADQYANQRQTAVQYANQRQTADQYANQRQTADQYANQRNPADQYANLPLASPEPRSATNTSVSYDHHQHYQPSTTFGVQQNGISRNNEVYGSIRQYQNQEQAVQYQDRQQNLMQDLKQQQHLQRQQQTTLIQEPAVVRPVQSPVVVPIQATHGAVQTTFGVRGAVPTPLSHVIQQGESARPLRPIRASAHPQAAMNQQNAFLNLPDLVAELDRLDSKGINMTEQETERYRKLLQITRDNEPRRTGSRQETLIDDVATPTTETHSPGRENRYPQYEDRLPAAAGRVQFTESTDIEDVVDLDSPAVVGTQEVYRDPRQRRLQNFEAQQHQPQTDGARLQFRDKMRLFASRLGEDTPQGRRQESSAQRQIHADAAQ